MERGKFGEFLAFMQIFGARYTPPKKGDENSRTNPIFNIGPLIEVQMTSNYSQAESNVFGFFVGLRHNNHYLPLGEVSTSQGPYEAVIGIKKVLTQFNIEWVSE